jgi:hypothetical protein
MQSLEDHRDRRRSNSRLVERRVRPGRRGSTKIWRAGYVFITDEYRGYSIKWDVIYKADKKLFAAQAAIVLHPDNSGTPSIHPVPGRDDFTTEDEARDYIIGAAKNSIDDAQR